MSTEMQTKVQASPAQNFTPVQTGLLQRKSVLCNTPGLVEDSKRDKEKLTLQRSPVDQAGTTTVPRFGHDFSRVSVHSTGPGMIQTKLKINKPRDPYEQEADRVANAVMRMREPGVQRQPESEEEEEEKQIKLKSNINMAPQVTPGIAHEILSLKGTGQPLPTSEREFFEPRFGRDFSNVRVHTDDRAARTAQTINAQAFTLGRDIVFGSGQYRAGNERGNKLLAHELTHVVQQSKSDRRSFRQERSSERTNQGPIPPRSNPTHHPRQRDEKRKHATEEGDVQRRSHNISRLGVQSMLQRVIRGKINLPSGSYNLRGQKLYGRGNRQGYVSISIRSLRRGRLPKKMMFRFMDQTKVIGQIRYTAWRNLRHEAKVGSEIRFGTSTVPRAWIRTLNMWEYIGPKHWGKFRGWPGYRKYGGPKVSDELTRLNNLGLINPKLKTKEIKVLNGIASVETGGRIGAVSTRDDMYVSIGFKQATLATGQLQKVILANDKTEHEFEKYDIKLDKKRTYSRKKYKRIKSKVYRIKGTTSPNELNSPMWVSRFYAASMEPDVVVALVNLARKDLQGVQAKTRSVLLKACKKPPCTGDKYFGNVITKALLTQVSNHRGAKRMQKVIDLALLYDARHAKTLHQFLGKIKLAMLNAYGKSKKERSYAYGIYKKILRYFRNSRCRSKIRIEARRLEKEVFRIFSIAINKGLVTYPPSDVSLIVQKLLKKETVMGVKRGVRKLVKAIDEFLATLKKLGFPSKTQLCDIRKRMNAVRALAKEMERW